eukprot:NODE_6631_length_862_cov_1.895805_g6034_i0.p2 GENE.NODE_6631_length_862_cov_1.895805_g6034_i0~~NODE_6631_length_862_cov_1.895805_g6034_i0.p2  ORF type:complete len:249 (+),score=-34.81 NODE_6631_length_862_cov_1.895805_g6034_i0:102-848(+)
MRCHGRSSARRCSQSRPHPLGRSRARRARGRAGAERRGPCGRGGRRNGVPALRHRRGARRGPRVGPVRGARRRAGRGGGGSVRPGHRGACRPPRRGSAVREGHRATGSGPGGDGVEAHRADRPARRGARRGPGRGESARRHRRLLGAASRVRSGTLDPERGARTRERRGAGAARGHPAGSPPLVSAPGLWPWSLPLVAALMRAPGARSARPVRIGSTAVCSARSESVNGTKVENHAPGSLRPDAQHLG